MFGHLFNNRSRLLGVDISTTAVKVLELSRGTDARYHIESYGVTPFSRDAVEETDIKDEEAVADALRTVLTKAHPGIKEAVVAIPASAVISKVLPFHASYTDDELEEQAYLEADRFVPYPIDEVNFDFEILGPNAKDEDKCDCLIVAARTEKVESRVGVLEMSGLRTRVVDVESYALERACLLIAEQLPKQGMDQSIAVFDIGASVTALTVMHNLETVYTREEPLGGAVLTERIQKRYGLTYEEAGRSKKFGGLADDYETEVLDPYRESFVPLIRRSLQFFFSATGLNRVDHIVLAGGGAKLVGLAELIEERLGIPTIVANPFADMTISPQIDVAALTADAPAMMLACGLALRSFD